ncbi:hypothetical protein [uncultured Alistipes sp.]|uniref:hypothetical protein n=1 Tax=uncultured Alistipes sp. TaxID=538949 RepID=UPI0026013EB9|nr:hypothetical protein [uncultured Alistipes sp.]
MFEKIRTFFQERPEYFGLFFILFGVVMLISGIRGSAWLFDRDVSGVTYSLRKIDGWINMFGKTTARVVVCIGAVMVILAGGFWLWAYACYYKQS